MDERRWTSLILTVAIVAFSGTGAWISGQLVKHHANLWNSAGTSDALFGRVCRAAESIGWDCTASRESRWSEIVIPVPLPTRDLSVRVRTMVVPAAFCGLAYFVFLMTWFVFVGRPATPPERWQHLPLIIGRVGVVVSLLYLVVMVAGSAPPCVWCAAVHALNLVTVLAIRRLYHHGEARRTVTEIPASRLGTRAVAFTLILICGLWFYRHEQLAMGQRIHALAPYRSLVSALRADSGFLLREHFAQPAHLIPPRPVSPETDPRPQLVVFTDYECPACNCEEQHLRQQALPAFNGELAISVRHFPLDDECNPAAPGPIHPHACKAAYAAEAARVQGGDEAFWRMHRLLFANRKNLTVAVFRQLAERLDLDVDRFCKDLESEAVRQSVRADVTLARELGVEETPSMFLDGRRITAFTRDNPVFWQAVAQERSATSDAEVCASAAP